MVRKSCSRSRWQGFEKFIAFMIGGDRVLGQAHKATNKHREDTLGDAQSDRLISECKARDPAPKKWRERNPGTVYTKIKIEMEWITQLVTEAAEVEKLFFLAYNLKFSQLIDTYIVVPVCPWNLENFANELEIIDVDSKTLTLDVADMPVMLTIDGVHYIACRLRWFIIKLHKEGYTKYENINQLYEAYKNRNKDDIDVKNC